MLDQRISDHELSNCFKQVDIIEPATGKRFWQAASAPTGIYLILAGKARLLDSADNLIMSLETGASFGELTLFPEENFQPYTARAGVN